MIFFLFTLSIPFIQPSAFCFPTKLCHYNFKSSKPNRSASLFRKNKLSFKANLIIKMISNFCFCWIFYCNFLLINSNKNKLGYAFLKAFTKSTYFLLILLVFFHVFTLELAFIPAFSLVSAIFTNNKLFKKFMEAYLAT